MQVRKLKLMGTRMVERAALSRPCNRCTSQSPQQRHPMTELERMVMELGGHTAREAKAALSPVALSGRSSGEGSPKGAATGSQVTDEVEGKIRLKLFLRK